VKLQEDVGEGATVLKDKVKFGEVVKAPPTLTAIPKPRLKEYIATVEETRKNNRKRREVKSLVERAALEKKREITIAAYRALKQNEYAEKNERLK